MINRILIANRGEIASRIIRTCRRMGIVSVAIYADADRGLPYVRAADQAINIGGKTPADSYLRQDKVLAAAQEAKVDAIHPGFGFLSENADFAKQCREAGFVFIGPSATAIHQMGLKSIAKRLMQEKGVPTISGYEGDEQSVDFLVKQAAKIGFPLLVKAAAGGGGKGMRVVHEESELLAAIKAAKSEAQKSFGNDHLILEQYFEAARHIEFQILGDKAGNIIHLLERECSLQRRYQKVLEESPSPVLDEALRAKMGAAAVQAAQAIGYENAGTVEFILNADKEFFFLEMNTRLQVEHPVTEMITGIDLVEWQIKVAEGTSLPWKQEDITANGYALECRLYAEDASNNFFPDSGTVLHWKTPDVDGLRVEAGIGTGTEVGIWFDPMLAKLIVHADNRLAAFRKMHYVLSHTACLGLKTNLPFLQYLTKLPSVQAGDYYTKFIEHDFDFAAFEQFAQRGNEKAVLARLLFDWAAREEQRSLIPQVPAAWRNNFYQPQEVAYEVDETEYNLTYTYQQDKFEVQLNGKMYAVLLVEVGADSLMMEVNGHGYRVVAAEQDEDTYLYCAAWGQKVVKKCPRFPEVQASMAAGNYQATMPGEVLEVHVTAGAKVAKGDALITLLSMKMENTIIAHTAATVQKIPVKNGDVIAKGTLLIEVEPTEGSTSG